MSVYNRRKNYRFADEFWLVSTAFAVTSLVCTGVLSFYLRDFLRCLLVIFMALEFMFLIVWMMAARFLMRIFKWPASEKWIPIVGAGDVGRKVGIILRENEWSGINMMGYLDDFPYMGSKADRRSLLAGCFKATSMIRSRTSFKPDYRIVLAKVITRQGQHS